MNKLDYDVTDKIDEHCIFEEIVLCKKKEKKTKVSVKWARANVCLFVCCYAYVSSHSGCLTLIYRR